MPFNKQVVIFFDSFLISKNKSHNHEILKSPSIYFNKFYHNYLSIYRILNFLNFKYFKVMKSHLNLVAISINESIGKHVLKSFQIKERYAIF